MAWASIHGKDPTVNYCSSILWKQKRKQKRKQRRKLMWKLVNRSYTLKLEMEAEAAQLKKEILNGSRSESAACVLSVFSFWL